MKYFLIFAVCIAALFNLSFAFADSADYSSLSFEELMSLKNAVDLEYNSRPESKGVEFGAGVYVVGIDILPGNYYATMIKPDPYYDYSFIAIYEDEKTCSIDKQNGTASLAKLTKSFNIGEEPSLIPLHEGNCIYITMGSVFLKASEFDPEEYYHYNIPEGTLVPAGVYNVPDDIPAGKYTAFPATVRGGSYSHYYNRANDNGEPNNGIESKGLRVYNEIDSEILNLMDGDKLDVSKSIILSTSPKLNFD